VGRAWHRVESRHRPPALSPMLLCITAAPSPIRSPDTWRRSGAAMKTGSSSPARSGRRGRTRSLAPLGKVRRGRPVVTKSWPARPARRAVQSFGDDFQGPSRAGGNPLEADRRKHRSALDGVAYLVTSPPAQDRVSSAGGDFQAVARDVPAPVAIDAPVQAMPSAVARGIMMKCARSVQVEILMPNSSFQKHGSGDAAIP